TRERGAVLGSYASFIVVVEGHVQTSDTGIGQHIHRNGLGLERLRTSRYRKVVGERTELVRNVASIFKSVAHLLMRCTSLGLFNGHGIVVNLTVSDFLTCIGDEGIILLGNSHSGGSGQRSERHLDIADGL